MEQLTQDIVNLETQETIYLDQLSNAETDEQGRQINNELNTVRYKLREKKEELRQMEEAQDAIVTEVQESGETFVLRIGDQEINFRDHTTNEESYQLLAIAVKQKIHQVESQLAAQSARHEQEREQFKAQLQAADEAAQRKYDELYEEFHTCKIERDELERKHQAAAIEVDALRREKEELLLLKPSPVATNLDNGAIAELFRKANEAKPAVYDIQQLDNLAKRYGAKLLETDEYIEFGYLEKGKYREASAEEAARFRQAMEEAKQNAMEPPEIVKDVVDVQGMTVPASETFQSDSETTTDRLDRDESVPESVENQDGGEVTRAEFETLKHEVTMLAVELKARSILPHNWAAA